MFILGVIICGLVWFLLKKNNQIKIKKKTKKPKPNPNRNWFKPTGFSSVRFLEQKPIQTGLTQFFPVWLGFFSFGSVFFV
jgi:hypothetical protein